MDTTNNIPANVQKIMDKMEKNNKISLSFKEKRFSNSARRGLELLKLADKKYEDGIKEYRLRISASQYIIESPKFMEYIKEAMKREYINIAKKYYTYAGEEFEFAKNKAHNTNEFDLKDKYKACKFLCDKKASATESNFEKFTRQRVESLKSRVK